MRKKKTTVNPESLKNLKPFKKGQTGNPRGRAKSTLGVVTAELKKSGYKIATRRQVTEAYLLVASLPAEAVMGVANNENYPMLVRIIAKEVMSKNGFDIIERILDRALGRPQQYIDHTSGEKPIENNTTIVQKMSDEDLMAEIRKLQEQTQKKKKK
jgi:hypothetical protein